MARGRRSWSNRRVVEDCRKLDIRSLVTLFAEPLSARTIGWTSGFEIAVHYRQNPGVDPNRLLGWAWGIVPKGAPEHREEACGTIKISRWVTGPYESKQIQQSAEIVAIPRALKRGRRFGAMKRYYFRCPGLDSKHPCRRRVSKLYKPYGEDYFACRACHDLTYESVKKHDKRVDFFLRHPEAIPAALSLNDFREAWPAMEAYARLLQRRLLQRTRK